MELAPLWPKTIALSISIMLFCLLRAGSSWFQQFKENKHACVCIWAMWFLSSYTCVLCTGIKPFCTYYFYFDMNALLLQFISLHIYVLFKVLLATSRPSLPLPVQSSLLLCGIQAGSEWAWLCEWQQLLWQPYSKLVPYYSFLSIGFPQLIWAAFQLFKQMILFCEVLSLKLIYNHIFLNKGNGWILVLQCVFIELIMNHKQIYVGIYDLDSTLNE